MVWHCISCDAMALCSEVWHAVDHGGRSPWNTMKFGPSILRCGGDGGRSGGGGGGGGGCVVEFMWEVGVKGNVGLDVR